MADCFLYGQGGSSGVKKEYLFKDGAWQTREGFTHAEVGNNAPVIESDYLKLYANGSQKFSGVNLKGLPSGYNMFVELANALSSNDNAYLLARIGDGESAYFNSGTYGFWVGAQSSPFTDYKVYSLPVSGNGSMFIATSSSGATSNFGKVKSIWLEKQEAN